MIDSKYVINIKGKKAILYNGLRDLATKEGIQSMKTEMLALPCKENEYTTIVKATVIMKDGRIFEDIGDANPNNVNKMIVGACPRMAQTRGYARVFRNLLNIDLVAVEELIEIEEAEFVPIEKEELKTPESSTTKTDSFVKKGREEVVANMKKENKDTDEFFNNFEEINLKIPEGSFKDDEFEL